MASRCASTRASAGRAPGRPCRPAPPRGPGRRTRRTGVCLRILCRPSGPPAPPGHPPAPGIANAAPPSSAPSPATRPRPGARRQRPPPWIGRGTPTAIRTAPGSRCRLYSPFPSIAPWAHLPPARARRGPQPRRPRRGVVDLPAPNAATWAIRRWSRAAAPAAAAASGRRHVARGGRQAGRAAGCLPALRAAWATTREPVRSRQKELGGVMRYGIPASPAVAERHARRRDRAHRCCRVPEVHCGHAVVGAEALERDHGSPRTMLRCSWRGDAAAQGAAADRRHATLVHGRRALPGRQRGGNRRRWARAVLVVGGGSAAIDGGARPRRPRG